MKVRNLGLILLAFLMLSGCSKEEGEDKSATQVVAKVNNEEVTVHQLNYLLRKSSGRLENAKEKSLEALVDQSLLNQAAEQVGLDRTPEYLLAVESAKRKILSDAYLQTIIAGIPKPLDSEIEQFYKDKAALFADRKLFVYDSIALKLEAEPVADLVKVLKETDSIKEVEASLKSKNIEYKIRQQAGKSEAVPRILLGPLLALKEGDVGLMQIKDGLLIISLKQVVDQPMSLEQAKPMIVRELFKQKQVQAVKNLVSGLRETAQIEYVGEFEGLNK